MGGWGQICQTPKRNLLSAGIPDSRKAQNLFSPLPQDGRSQAYFCREGHRPHKLAGMSQAERAGFFRNTERWNGMTNAERKKWRTLVTQMPPLPPGFGNELSPPLPPGLVDESVPVQTVVTNTIR